MTPNATRTRYRHRGTANIVDAHQWWGTVESEIHISNMLGPEYTTDVCADGRLDIHHGEQAFSIPLGWWVAEGLMGGFQAMSPETFAEQFDEIEVQEAG